MSTTPIAAHSIRQELQAFFHNRRSDLQQLAKDLRSGDLTTAQEDYQTLQSLGQSGPFAMVLHSVGRTAKSILKTSAPL